MHIRVLRPEDLPLYQALRLRALHDDPTAFSSSYEEEAARPPEYFARRLAPRPDSHMVGAFTEGGLVGMASVTREQGPKEHHKAVIRSVFVAIEHRGHGVGRRLLARALAIADGMPGLRQVTLAVTAGNSAAVALYEAGGFTAYGRAPEALFVGGAYYDEILMVRFTPARGGA